ncbi:MAG: QueT transporter family protein [Clostridiales bacterium]|nr:QueT transporter family protein [Clostridiales bacterium]
MNVYDKAHELASTLKVTPEVVEYVEAVKKIGTNESNKRMVEDFRRKQMELYTIQMQGMEPSKGQIDSLTNLWNVISVNPEIRGFMESEMKFSKLWEDIMKILNDVVGLKTLMLGETAFGPIQFRISEALTILPFFEPAAIPGLFVGCFLANIFGGYGFVDIFFGSLTTLLAAYLTSKMPNKYLATLPPILLNALIIPLWISTSSSTYLATVYTFGFSEFISAGILGVALASVFQKVIDQYKH